jgi:hypothetical protein
MLLWLLLLAFFLLAVLKSSWWWLAAGCAALACGRRLYRHSRPWWRTHRMMLRIYIGTSAFEDVLAKREHRDFNAYNAIHAMVGKMQPEWGDGRIEEFVRTQLERVKAPEYIESIINEARAVRPKSTTEELDGLRTQMARVFQNPTNTLMVRIAIAGIIEERLGPDARAVYMDQVLDGLA